MNYKSMIGQNVGLVTLYDYFNILVTVAGVSPCWLAHSPQGYDCLYYVVIQDNYFHCKCDLLIGIQHAPSLFLISLGVFNCLFVN